MILNNSGVSQLVLGLMAKVVSPFASKEPKTYNNCNMLTSSDEVITAHNSSVGTRQVKRSTERLNKKLGK